VVSATANRNHTKHEKEAVGIVYSKNALNDKWMKILALEADLKTRGAAPKSFPRRRLLPDSDDKAAANEPLMHDHVGQADRPPRG
jgi:hypothetical protein